MKIWLDDKRTRPDNTWIHCNSVNETLTLLSHIDVFNVEEVSIDTDLGKFSELGGDGHFVILWMAENRRWPKRLTVHSNDEKAAETILKAVDKYGPYRTKPAKNSRGVAQVA